MAYGPIPSSNIRFSEIASEFGLESAPFAGDNISIGDLGRDILGVTKTNTISADDFSNFQVDLPTEINGRDTNDAGGPSTATAGLYSDGTSEFTTAFGGDWCNPTRSGVGAAYEVLLTGSGTTPSGPALNTWHSLSSDRLWSLTDPADTGAPGSPTTFTGLLRVRLAATGTQIDSCSFELYALSFTDPFGS